MTSNQITRALCAGAIGLLSSIAFGLWGILVAPSVIFLSILIGETLGDDES